MFTLMKLIPFRVHWIHPSLDYEKKKHKWKRKRNFKVIIQSR